MSEGTDERIGPWMGTWSGGRFYPLDPRPEEVFLLDIAQSLSKQCRYLGHSLRFYSVAQHSTICATILLGSHGPLMAMQGLLHDAAEAYLGDLISPLKIGTRIGEMYLEHEAKLHDVIMTRFGLFAGDLPDPVKEADRRVLATEAKTLVASTKGWNLAQPYAFLVAPVGPEEALMQFLKTADMLWKMLHNGQSVYHVSNPTFSSSPPPKEVTEALGEPTPAF
jgi:hypothetical protein